MNKILVGSLILLLISGVLIFAHTYNNRFSGYMHNYHGSNRGHHRGMRGNHGPYNYYDTSKDENYSHCPYYESNHLSFSKIEKTKLDKIDDEIDSKISTYKNEEDQTKRKELKIEIKKLLNEKFEITKESWINDYISNILNRAN